ncbi:hypothetical protein [Paraburkholderia antibiotica]|uniref:DGQHR domain-containing protein n=1 Tax=Paraburkholderia antibiotica TaxID=2728839 RepID=A0A7Y0A1R4_9BURK|nr:hypothetical protein [Paraburkholderia antibiotica]NML34913.1 hypothetical protein [Paraburkholderia antibiotica]
MTKPVSAYETITPAIARNWLGQNTANRNLRRNVVDGYKSIFDRGEYKITHQGIAFIADGTLVDGQHRLTAISEMPDDFSVVMLVTRGLDEDAYMAIDLGLKRTAADVLRENSRVAEVSRFLAALVANNKSAITPAFMLPFVEYFRPAHDELMDFCPTASKTWSSAPVRAAAILQLVNGANPDYVKSTYRALVLMDVDAMPTVAKSLFKSALTGHVSASGRLDMLCRCLKAFQPENHGLRQIRINQDEMVAVVRKFLNDNIVSVEQKKTAATSATVKKFKQPNYRIVGL